MKPIANLITAGASLLLMLGFGLATLRDASSDGRVLALAEAALDQGGSLSLQRQEPGASGEISIWPWGQECVTGKNCVGMGNDNNGFDCSSYTMFHPGAPAPQPCRSKPCVYTCPGSFTGGLCESAWFESCTDTTLTNSPGLCGVGEKGHCSFSSSGDPNTTVTFCTALGLCYGGDGRVNCGVARTCQ